MKHPDNVLHGLENLIQDTMPGWEIPGLAIGVIKDDDLVFAQGFGQREIGTGQPVDENTIFAIGSNTKAFTATALGLLVQEGKLSWDDPVLQYLPGFQLFDPYVTREIRVRDLLCHRSGLPTWGGDLLSYGSTYTQDEILHRIRHIPLTLKFRSDYGYSNMMFSAAGKIIAVVAQSSWEEFIKQRLFQPLGMTRSSTSINQLADADNIAMPHEKISGQIQSLPYRNLDNHHPAGAINSTVIDMIQWLRFQLNNGQVGEEQLLKASILEETHTPHTLNPLTPEMKKLMPIPTNHFRAYGLGWGLMDYQGQFVIIHSGGVDGMLSMTAMLPEINLGIVILTNKLPHYLPSTLFFHIVDAYLDAPTCDWNKSWHTLDQNLEEKKAEKKKKFEEARVQDTQPTLSLAEYAGTYTSSIYGKAQVTHEDERLLIQLSAHPSICGQLEHWHYDTFLCRWTDPVFDKSIMPFAIDRNGKVKSFKLSVRPDWIDPLEYVFERDEKS